MITNAGFQSTILSEFNKPLWKLPENLRCKPIMATSKKGINRNLLKLMFSKHIMYHRLYSNIYGWIKGGRRNGTCNIYA